MLAAVEPTLTTFSRRLALVAGVFVPALETWRRWDDFSHWPSILDDYVAGAFLLLAAIWHRRGHPKGLRLLAAAWGVASGMMYLSFVGQLTDLSSPDPSGFPSLCVAAVKGVFLLLCALGLIGALAGDAPARG
jgi:hypothetical protein